MRTGAAAGHTGYFHEAAFYGSDAELLAIVEPFLREGVEAGEPTLVTFGPRNTELVRRALPDLTGVEFIEGELQYANAARTVADYRRRFARLVDAGAQQIRVVGDVPHPGTGAGWGSWARYEAVVNRAFDDFPLWGMCPYDTRCTPDDVLEEVRRTHPRIAGADGCHHVNDAFTDPAVFLRGRVWRDAVEGPADLDLLVTRGPREARNATLELIDGRVGPEVAGRLVLAISELAANAVRHGAPPARLRVWLDGEGGAAATVEDAGPGAPDPLMGLMPPTDADAIGGRGLWITHALCDDVSLDYAAGFAVHVVVREHPE